MSRRHRPKAGFWIRLCVVVIAPIDRALFRLRWHHVDRIPERGGVLLAVNHLSQIDPLTMALFVWQAGRLPRFLIKEPVFRLPVIGAMMSGAGQIRVHRGTSRASSSLDEAVAALRAGECVIIYPEGTITHDETYWPMQAKSGVARIALAAPEIPLLPIGQWGAQQTLGRNGRFRPFPRKLHQASVGEPIDLSRFLKTEPDAALFRNLTAEIQRAITAQVAELRGEPAPAELTAWKGPKRFTLKEFKKAILHRSKSSH